jgi:hypothetical protein
MKFFEVSMGEGLLFPPCDSSGGGGAKLIPQWATLRNRMTALKSDKELSFDAKKSSDKNSVETQVSVIKFGKFYYFDSSGSAISLKRP